MDPARPELPRGTRRRGRERSRVYRTRSLIAVAGTGLLAVAGIAAAVAPRSPRPVQVSQVANVSVDATSALADNWYESAPYYSVLDSAAPDLGAAWSPSATYVSGDVVSYNGDQWTANQWNYDEVPGGPSGAWNNDGAC